MSIYKIGENEKCENGGNKVKLNVKQLCHLTLVWGSLLIICFILVIGIGGILKYESFRKDQTIIVITDSMIELNR